ncbi:MAG: L,D-transpeptidase family protein [Candidatus Omnitrophica bacterium]|nr:L,D-transpeptidase family protein [Candidatus Omnitrophota bacterium]
MNRRFLLIGLASVLIILFGFFLTVVITNQHSEAVKEKARKAKIESIANLAKEARELQEKGSFLEAQSLYQSLINDYPNSTEASDWQRELEGLNIKLLFSPILTAKSELYEIKPGDTLVKIAKDYNTTTELIMRSNNLSEDKIFPRRKIKVWTAPFTLLADKSQNTLILKSGEEIIKTYIVSTGINNSTPSGNFKIVNKLTNPTWFKSGAVVAPNSPDNILGSRWLGFNLAGYGIHGTSSPQDLGKQVTEGCLRMSNADVEELFAIVPIGTEITIVD